MLESTTFFTLFLGIGLLFGGAECLIHGSASLALKMGMSLLIIGLTIVGYGTGTPELVVCLQASLADQGDIVVGNIIGSNISNIALILGFVVLCRPISVKQQLVRQDGPIMVLIAFVFSSILFFFSVIGRAIGFFFLCGFVLYTFWIIYSGRRDEKVEAELKVMTTKQQPSTSFFHDLFFILIGFFCLFLGGKWFLESAIEIARYFHISNAVIGLTVVAIGTSIPEFATSIVALFRKHADLALGNVVGSNIFNILALIGASALLNPLHLKNIDWVDYTYMTLLSAFLWINIYTGKKLVRLEGFVMLASYIVYIIYLANRF